MHSLKKLDVYRKALALTKKVHLVARSFPKDELFGLTAQFKRAGDSIALNIAEGAGNTSRKEFKRFLDYAIRSGFECIGCLDIALENEYIVETLHRESIEAINEVIAMCCGLQKHLDQTSHHLKNS